MDFSELLKHGGHAVFSPDHKYLATNEKYRLFIRDAESLELLHIYTCLDVISHMVWSPDSQYILCAQYKRRIVQVWSVSDAAWTCKIDEGVAGLSYACWSPDGRHILTTTEFQLRMTVWSLCDQSVSYIKFPKFAGSGYDFSHDGRYLLVLERRDYHDYIGMYHCANWSLIKHFPIETQDCVEIKWSPDDRVVAVWDSCLDYHILIYSPDGRRLSSYRAYEHALGIKSVAWSPSSQFLAVGSYDEVARIFNNVTWKTLAEYTHPSTVTGKHVVVYTEQSVRLTALDKENKQPLISDSTPIVAKEEEQDVDASNDASFRQKLQALKQRSQALNTSRSTSSKPSSPVKATRKPSLKSSTTTAKEITAALNGPVELTLPSKYVVSTTPLEVLQVKPDPEKPNPKMGVGLLEWSVGDRFLLTRNDNMPNTLWIWDTLKLTVVSILHHLESIRYATWDPCRTRLALCTGNNKLYLWAPQGASIVDVPTQAGPFCVNSLQWNCDGNSILLMDKSKLSVCYMPPS